MSARRYLLLPISAAAFALAVHCMAALRSPMTNPIPSSIQSVHAIIALPSDKELAWLQNQASQGAKVRLIHANPEINPETIPGVSTTQSTRSETWTEGVLLNAVCFVPRTNLPTTHPSPTSP
jgi:hypothetical protein